MSDFIPEDLFVGEPVFTVRWRLQNRALPLKNRHLRSFAQSGVSTGLASWARQHIEWTLAEGTAEHPNGVLVLSVDDQGRAVMTAEAYEALPGLTAAQLLERAGRQVAMPVAGEVAWVYRAGAFTVLAEEGKPLSGANSLMADLAKTLGKPVAFAAWDQEALAGLDRVAGDEVLLVSDEHGVVGAADAGGVVAAQFQAYYGRLVAATKPDLHDRANLGLFA